MQDNINKKTGQLLKEARKNKNFTLEELARRYRKRS